MFEFEVDEIVSIETLDEEDVYDIAIEDAHHLFYANDVLVHNCAHSVSYSYITYQCAWLMTYYEPEWLCSYVESMLGDPDSRRRAISEIKEMGYDVGKVDINHSSKEWTISDDGKTFYPSFFTVKGVGESAVKEILTTRPYRSLDDLLWDRNGEWRHSKFNAKAMDALLRIGAFDSIGIVGPDKKFKSYRQLHHVLIDGQDELKKRLKKDPERHLRRLEELVQEASELPDWDRGEIVKSQIEIFGAIDPDFLLDEDTRSSLNQHEISPIELVANGGMCWFILSDAKRKVTKNGKNYLVLDCIGSDSSNSKIFIWGCGNFDPSKLNKYSCYMAKIKKDKFGMSSYLNDIREVG